MDTASGIMATSDETKHVDIKEVSRIAASEANRVRLQNKYATDAEYRERVKTANRENAAKRRAAERERRQAALEAGEPVPPRVITAKLGRPRRQPTDLPVPRSRRAAEDGPA